MRLEIELTATAAAWRATYDLTGAPGAIVLPPRELPRQAAFPLPPATEAQAAVATEAHAALVQAITPAPWQAVVERVATRQASAADEQTLGRALFAALLGDAVWQSVRQQAAGAALDLHLALPTAAPELHRLPWELLHNGQEFLCLDTQQPTNLLRTLRLPAGGGVMTPLPVPVRVLFVLGGDFGDAALQEGAGFLALLRHLRTPDNLSINSRVLVKASLTALKDGVQSFQPSVIHLIASATLDGAGQPRISLPDRFNRAAVQQHSALDLVRTLREACPGASLPLLSLHLGAARAEVAPLLATRLVAEGVPLVAVLAGDLSNYAARLFARGAYEALLSGQSLAVACADGRRAFRQMGISPQAWAGPLLVANAASSLTPVFADASLARQLADLDLQYRQSNSIFCDRFQLWDSATAAFLGRGGARIAARPDRRTVLAVEVTEPDQGLVAPRFGKTRFLEELARHALQDNYVPIVFSLPPGADVPKTLLDLALKLVGKIIEVRAWFGLPRLELPRDSEVVKLNLLHRGQQLPVATSTYQTGLIRQLILAALTKDDLDTLIFDHFREVHDALIAQPAADRVQRLIEFCDTRLEFGRLFGQIATINPARFAQFEPLLGAAIKAGPGLHPSIQEQFNLLSAPAYNAPGLVAAALRLDLAALAAASRLAGNSAQRRLLLLLDDLHRFDEPIVRDLLNTLITNRGLALAEDPEPLPVVLTFSKAGVANEATDGVIRSFLGRVYVMHQELKSFTDIEARLAYTQFLFWRSLYPDPDQLPLVVSHQASPADVQTFFERLAATVGGAPSRLFNNDPFLQVIEEAQAAQILEEVQDDLLLGRI